MFLVAIIDLFTRKVVGYSMRETPNSKLVIKAIKNAINIQKPIDSIILHLACPVGTDRGIQFTSEETTKIYKKHKIIQSFSALGCPYNNAPMESFVTVGNACGTTLKKEEVRQHNYKSIKEAKLSIFEYTKSLTKW